MISYNPHFDNMKVDHNVYGMILSIETVCDVSRGSFWYQISFWFCMMSVNICSPFWKGETASHFNNSFHIHKTIDDHNNK